MVNLPLNFLTSLGLGRKVHERCSDSTLSFPTATAVRNCLCNIALVVKPFYQEGECRLTSLISSPIPRLKPLYLTIPYDNSE